MKTKIDIEKTLSHFIGIGIVTLIMSAGATAVCADDKLNIVTTTTNLKSIAQAVGGDHVKVDSITGGGEDPHFIEAKPSYMMKTQKADLWIRSGLELEIGYEELIIDGSRNTRIRIGTPGHLDVSEGIVRLEVPTQKLDRSMGDVHPLGNPHYWMDPYNGRIIAKNICRRLQQLDPTNTQAYETNLAAFLQKIDAAMFGSRLVEKIGGERLWKLQINGTLESFIENSNRQSTTDDKESLTLSGWLAKFKPYSGTKIVTYHRSWSYFANRFSLIVSAELESKPGIPPSPRHLLNVINAIQGEKIKIILMEPYYNEKDAKAVSVKTGDKVSVVPNAVGDRKEADSYIAMLDNAVEKLVEALAEGNK